MTQTLLYILGIVAVLIGIALSIGLHELGHFLPAKLFGVRVKQFMIGFGPTVRSWRRGDTEFGVKAIPLGGYILMTGMYPPEKKPYSGPFSSWIRDARNAERSDVLITDENRQFHKLTVPRKLLIMLGGPLMNLVLGFVLIVTALSGIGPTQNSLEVAKVFDCIDAAPDGSCAAGAAISPAKSAGLEPGDRVIQVNGKPVISWTEAVAGLEKGLGSSSTLIVDRAGDQVSIQVTPVFIERQVYDPAGNPMKDETGLPITEIRPILGIQLAVKSSAISLNESLAAASNATFSTFGFIFTLPQQVWGVGASIFGLQERDPNGAVSILGVGQLAGELTATEDIPVSAKIASLLMLLGSLNIALFAFNLLPILPLDGGHVLGALYEGAKRRGARLLGKPDPGPVDTAKALPLAYAVWLLLIVVGVILIFADAINPIQLG